MAVLIAVGKVPTSDFFDGTPPRDVSESESLEKALAALLKKECKYVLAQSDSEPLPEGVEICVTRDRQGGRYSLFKRRGEKARSDRRARAQALTGAPGPTRPYSAW